MNNKIESTLYMIGILILMGILYGFPLMILWNWIMPHLIGASYITFWEACGLHLMASILFKSGNSNSQPQTKNEKTIHNSEG